MLSKFEAFKAQLTPDGRGVFDALAAQTAIVVDQRFGGNAEPATLGRVIGGAMPFLSGDEQRALTACLIEAIQGILKKPGKMMQVQMAMQRENHVYSAVSNVLKTRHDTVKNSIGNIK